MNVIQLQYSLKSLQSSSSQFSMMVFHDDQDILCAYTQLHKHSHQSEELMVPQGNQSYFLVLN